MNRRKLIIGIDIGGTNIRGILYDGKKILKKLEIKTTKNKKHFSQKLHNFMNNLSDGKIVKGVGIGTAGVIRGTVLQFSPNLPNIKNLDFKKIIPKGMSLRRDNDARSFARG